jgi:preprotein translocase subunit SecD
MGHARHQIPATIHHAKSWFLMKMVVLNLFTVVLGLTLVGQPAFALPYGSDTVNEALQETEKRLAGKKLSKLVIGSWKVEVPSDIARDVAIAKLALDPSSEKSVFEKLKPTDLEVQTYKHYRKMVTNDADSEAVMTARTRVKTLGDTNIDFSENKVIIHAAGAERVQTYKILSANTNTLRIYWLETSEVNDCVFINADSIRIFGEGEEKVRLSRN